jgi:hypothetical protein
MRIRVPSKKVRERFLLIYELEGCKKAVDFLTKYGGVRRMKTRLNGRKLETDGLLLTSKIGLTSQKEDLTNARYYMNCTTTLQKSMDWNPLRRLKKRKLTDMQEIS